jgi:plastocyanin
VTVPCCRYATAAGVGIASLGLALSANAANVNLGAAGGALVFDPAEITIKSGETVTWTNKIGFPHNVVFDEDGIPVSTPFPHLACKHSSRADSPHCHGKAHDQ